MANKQVDKRKIFTKVMACVLAGLMVVSIAGTLIYYLVAR